MSKKLLALALLALAGCTDTEVTSLRLDMAEGVMLAKATMESGEACLSDFESQDSNWALESFSCRKHARISRRFLDHAHATHGRLTDGSWQSSMIIVHKSALREEYSATTGAALRYVKAVMSAQTGENL